MDIDSLKISFSSDELGILNFGLGFLMFGVAMDIHINDFKNIFIRPKPVIVGLISQLLLLPLLTLGLTIILPVQPSIALGMMLVAACPGGNVSNFATHIAKGNTALSVLLTSASTSIAFFMTPLLFAVFSKFIPHTAELRQQIQVEPNLMILSILKMIVLPLLIGMSLNHFFPKLASKTKSPTKILSMLIFFTIIVLAIAKAYKNLAQFLDDVFFIVLIHNALAFLVGYVFATLMGLSLPERKTVSIETGIQNSGLALILIFNFFNGLGGMVMIAAWWGVWHLIAGFGLATWWSRRS